MQTHQFFVNYGKKSENRVRLGLLFLVSYLHYDYVKGHCEVNMCKDKKMLALIVAIFLSVLFITGWVFADRNVMDLISVTPIFTMKNTASAPAVVLPENPAALSQTSDTGMCLLGDDCQ